MKKHYGFFQLPIYASYYNGKVYVTKLINTYSENSFHFGDIIQSINGLSFEEYYNQDSSYVWGSNYNRKRNTALENYIKLQKEERTVVKVLRNDTLLELVCLPIKIESIKTNNIVNYCNSKDYLLGSNFLYLDLSKIDSSNFEKLIRSGNKPYLIIDLRTYPNWVLTQISDLFSQDTVPFAAYRSPVITNPGAFGSPNRIYLKPKKDSNKVQYTKIILMVDYTTISRGEFIGMALQALPNVLTFGNSTAGADGNVTKIHLPGNISTQFTGLEILYPTGKETQKIGINVDIKYELTGKGFLQGYDEALAFLIENIIMEGN
jgi:C-terminal processing protease CtpA/Prc